MTDTPDTTPAIPAAAIDVAAAAILTAPYPKVGEGTARNFAHLAIKAAMPHLIAAGVAAERQRIRDAWDYPPQPRRPNQPTLDWRARAVLDLLDGDTP